MFVTILISGVIAIVGIILLNTPIVGKIAPSAPILQTAARVSAFSTLVAVVIAATIGIASGSDAAQLAQYIVPAMFPGAIIFTFTLVNVNMTIRKYEEMNGKSE